MAYACAEPTNQELNDLIDAKFREFREGSIVKGTILAVSYTHLTLPTNREV